MTRTRPDPHASYREHVSSEAEAVEEDVQMSKHTPTPWIAEPNAYGTWFIYRTEMTETAPTGLRYRQLVCGGDGYRTLSVENAAFIVEAVNNYESLRAQLATERELVKRQGQEIVMTRERDEALESQLATAREALEESRAAFQTLDHPNGNSSGLELVRGGKTIGSIIDAALNSGEQKQSEELALSRGQSNIRAGFEMSCTISSHHSSTEAG